MTINKVETYQNRRQRTTRTQYQPAVKLLQQNAAASGVAFAAFTTLPLSAGLLIGAGALIAIIALETAYANGKAERGNAGYELAWATAACGLGFGLGTTTIELAGVDITSAQWIGKGAIGVQLVLLYQLYRNHQAKPEGSDLVQVVHRKDRPDDQEDRPDNLQLGRLRTSMGACGVAIAAFATLPTETGLIASGCAVIAIIALQAAYGTAWTKPGNISYELATAVAVCHLCFGTTTMVLVRLEITSANLLGSAALAVHVALLYELYRKHQGKPEPENL